MNDLDVAELPWPAAGDRLIMAGHGPESQFNACLNFSNHPNYGYIEGYRLGGRAVMDRIRQQPAELDCLVYPLIFNYRHFLELSLKDIVRRGAQALEVSTDVKITHGLMPLWQDARPLILELEPSTETAVLDAVQSNLQELHDLDKRSMSFRYATTKGDAVTLPPDLYHINVARFELQVEKIANFLECVRLGIDGRLEALAEEAYYLEELRGSA